MFIQTLYYNESYGGSKAQYNGNISAMDWTVSGDKKRGYAFKYDALSRLTAASYLENGTLTTTDGKMPNYNTTYTYDKHGNITSLTRYGQKSASASDFGIVDQFTTMTYAGNQLKKVVDGGANANFAASNDFKDWSGGKGEYTYNANGAMDKDTHKGILEIKYNSLNLPQELTVKNLSTVGKIYYTYSATGAKLKVNYLASANLANTPVLGITDQDKLFEINETTDYIGNIIYEKGSLKRILIDGGYVEGGVYYFYLTDHLGNNRVVANATGTPIQKNHYYPFGTPFAETSKDEQGKQPYKYNDKEYQQMHQLNLYDYSARQMDGIRFTSVDPLAEKYYSISPYAYVMNNPLRFIDPTGMSSEEKPSEQENRKMDVNIVKSLQIKKYVDMFFSYLAAAMGVSSEQINSEDPQVRADASQRRQETAENVETASDVLLVILPGGTVIEVVANASQGNGEAVLAALPFLVLDVTTLGKGSGAVKAGKTILSAADILRIENAATKIGKPITVVGSRASGAAGAFSDWDYVIEGLNSKAWSKIKNSLPEAKSVIDNTPKNIDLIKTPLDKTKPYITIFPRKK